VLRERKPSGIVRSSAVCEGQVLQLGAQGGRERKKRKKTSYLRAQTRTVCFP
jgi:hypothetical protein